MSCRKSQEELKRLLENSDSNDLDAFCTIMDKGYSGGLQLVHEAPSPYGETPDPVALIRAVNALQEVGVDKATDVLVLYTQLATTEVVRRNSHIRRKYGLDEYRVLLVLRLLFVRAEGYRPPPELYLGRPDITRADGDDSWPLFPLALVDDIPFMLVESYLVAGGGRSPVLDVKFCKANCKFREKPLVPRVSPVAAAQKLIDSERWQSLFALEPNNGWEPNTAFYIRRQAVTALADVYDASGNRLYGTDRTCASPDEAEEEWGRLLEEIERLNPQWDPVNQAYVIPQQQN